MEKKIIVVAGPTASGKSDFAVNLALRNSKGDLSRAMSRDSNEYEIISADSRQVYVGLDIGTGKITHEEMKGVPHHMLDVFDVGDDVSVSTYKEKALAVLEDIFARGKTPIICGGTGQYVDALIYDQALPHVPPNKSLREDLEKKSTEELISQLQELDSVRLAEIGTHNRVRLIRAIEISMSLGTVPKLSPPTLRYPTTMYIMTPSRELMRERIHTRLLKRLDQGMLDEVKQCLTRGITHAQLERLGLEYRYLSRFLRGELSYEDTVEQLSFKSCQYAKRQLTWLKKYPKDTNIELHIVPVEK